LIRVFTLLLFTVLLSNISYSATSNKSNNTELLQEKHSSSVSEPQEDSDKEGQVQYLPARQSKTIYINISGLASHTRHASKMTDSHDKHAATGWSVISVIPLIENGDLEGFYVTYSREILEY
jgi:hypothetical protein